MGVDFQTVFDKFSKNTFHKLTLIIKFTAKQVWFQDLHDNTINLKMHSQMHFIWNLNASVKVICKKHQIAPYSIYILCGGIDFNAVPTDKSLPYYEAKGLIICVVKIVVDVYWNVYTPLVCCHQLCI